MMIKKLDATFGKLEGESLELHDGLNVISAPNESGKSTWCAFVRAMLYGVDSSDDFDIRTFEVKARPVAKVDGLRPGMTVTVNWDEIR